MNQKAELLEETARLLIRAQDHSAQAVGTIQRVRETKKMTRAVIEDDKWEEAKSLWTSTLESCARQRRYRR
jgi:hypothetical protein